MDQLEVLVVILTSLAAGFAGGYLAHCRMSAARYSHLRQELYNLEQRVQQRTALAEHLRRSLLDDRK